MKRRTSDEDSLDIEPGSFTRHLTGLSCRARRLQAGSRSSWFPDGPADLKGVLARGRTAVEEVLAYSRSHDVPELQSNLEEWAQHDFVLTESFAGSVCFQASCCQMLYHIQDACGIPSEKKRKGGGLGFMGYVCSFTESAFGDPRFACVW